MAAPLKTESEGLKLRDSNKNAGTDESKRDTMTKKAVIFGFAGIAMNVGFGFSIYKSVGRVPLLPKKLRKELMSQEVGGIPVIGIPLACKALAYATVITVATFGVGFYGLFKICGINNIYELTAKVRKYFPEKEKTGRSEFKNVQELADYLISEDRKAELSRQKQLLIGKPSRE